MTGHQIELTFETEVPVPPARLFEALTDARHLAHWFCDRAVSDPRPDGELVLAWDGPFSTREPLRGRWTIVISPVACAYRGGHSGYPDGDAGDVAFELQAVPAGTRLRTRHTMPGRPEYEPFADRYRAAWPRALARLVAYMAPDPNI